MAARRDLTMEALPVTEAPPHLLEMARTMVNRIGSRHDDYSEEWPRLAPPASKITVKNLREGIIRSGAGSQNCSICLKNFDVNEKFKEMPCHHQFHPICILTWLDRTNSCPFCRHELPTDDEEYENFKKEKKAYEERKEKAALLRRDLLSCLVTYMQNDHPHSYQDTPTYNMYTPYPSNSTFHGPNYSPNHSSSYGPSRSPFHGPRRGPLHGPFNGPFHGSFHSPYHGPFYGPMNGRFHGPMDGPFHGPMDGPFHGSMDGPFHGPMDGPFHGPIDGPFHAPNSHYF